MRLLTILSAVTFFSFYSPIGRASDCPVGQTWQCWPKPGTFGYCKCMADGREKSQTPPSTSPFSRNLSCSDGTHSIHLSGTTFVEQISASGKYIVQTDEGSANWITPNLVEVTVFTRAFYDLKPTRLAYPIVKNLRIAADQGSVAFEGEDPIQCTNR